VASTTRSPAASGHREVQRLLVGVQMLLGRLEQQRQLLFVMRGTDVVNPDHYTATFVHDLTAVAPEAVLTRRTNDPTIRQPTRAPAAVS
jgi:hypothetical protein